MHDADARLDSYKHLREFESDFDRSQSQARRVASLWILAGFAALSYLLAMQTPPTQATNYTPPAFGVLGVLVCGLEILGLYLLWYIDQNIYQRLLHSVFVYGLAMELKHNDLPKIRTTMWISNLNITNKLSKYYRIPIVSFFIFGLILTYYSSANSEILHIGHNAIPFWFNCIIYTSFILFSIIIYMRIQNNGGETEWLVNKYQDIYEDGTFSTLNRIKKISIFSEE